MKKQKGFVSIIAAVIILVVGFAGLFSYSKKLEEKMGATIPISVAVFETTLSSKITTTDTSMTLVTGADKAGADLNGYICFTLDGGKTNEEFVCGTASSTAVSAMIRGLSPVTASSSTSLAKEHRAGSNVKITDWPTLGILSRILNGDETIPNRLSYSTSTFTFTSGSGQIPTIAYVDSVATSGAAQANYSVSGLVRLATTSQLTVGTATSSATTYLVAPSALFNQTSSATYIVPITGSGGKLSTGFIDQTGNYTWSGTSTFSGIVNVSGTTTFSGATTLASTTISNALSVTGTSTFSATATFTKTPIMSFYKSDAVILASDAATSTTAASYTKLKELKVYFTGTIRVKFDINTSNVNANTCAKVYIDDVATGTERCVTSTSSVTYTQDFTGITNNNNIQLYGKVEGGNTIYAQNFRVCAGPGEMIQE